MGAVCTKFLPVFSPAAVVVFLTVHITTCRSPKNCPLNYEPSGTDFLSPCLAEADLMARYKHGTY
jgi:hypothetical protein